MSCAPKPLTAVPPPARAARVFIVEDDRVTARLVARILHGSGYEAEIYGSGEPALEAFDKGAPDVVILDLGLPDCSGLEVLDGFRLRGTDMPIVMLTASTNVDDVVAAMQLGAYNYLTKPVDARKLLATVDNAVQLGATRRELEQTQSMLIEAAKERAVSGLAAGVAHEIRNPLAIISQCLEFLGEEGHDSPEAPRLVRTAAAAVQRADRVARGLLEFAADGQGPMTVDDLRDLITGTLELAGHQATAHQVTLRSALPDTPLPVLFHRARLQHALMNLIDNAIKASSVGGVVELRAESVRLDRPLGESLRAGDLAAVVQVRDGGTGLEHGLLERVFEPFFTTRAPGSGQGLGLAVAKRIVELHRGDIQLRNASSAGAIATIVLPMEGES